MSTTPKIRTPAFVMTKRLPMNALFEHMVPVEISNPVKNIKYRTIKRACCKISSTSFSYGRVLKAKNMKITTRRTPTMLLSCGVPARLKNPVIVAFRNICDKRVWIGEKFDLNVQRRKGFLTCSKMLDWVRINVYEY